MIPVAGSSGEQEVNLDIDNDGQPDIIITIQDDGDALGSLTDNGDGSYDVTGAAQIELPAANGAIDVPTNATVTVVADGTTSLDAGETVTLTVPDVSQTAPRSLFVRIADPSAN